MARVKNSDGFATEDPHAFRNIPKSLRSCVVNLCVFRLYRRLLSEKRLFGFVAKLFGAAVFGEITWFGSWSPADWQQPMQ